MIDLGDGALHENSDGLTLSPPKTEEFARPVELPPFLVWLLAAYLDSHRHSAMFPAPDGGWQGRSNYARCAFRPAVDGNSAQARPKALLPEVLPGLKFHGMRYGHKTWIVSDGFHEVTAARRLGHKLRDKIADTHTPRRRQPPPPAPGCPGSLGQSRRQAGALPDWRSSAGDPDGD